MHTIAYLFRRKPGMSKAQFLDHYERHREVMLNSAKGLISYEQYPILPHAGAGEIYLSGASKPFDALSIYIYSSAEDAEHTTLLSEVIVDSQKFIDFDTMISITATKNKVL